MQCCVWPQPETRRRNELMFFFCQQAVSSGFLCGFPRQPVKQNSHCESRSGQTEKTHRAHLIGFLQTLECFKIKWSVKAKLYIMLLRVKRTSWIKAFTLDVEINNLLLRWHLKISLSKCLLCSSYYFFQYYGQRVTFIAYKSRTVWKTKY